MSVSKLIKFFFRLIVRIKIRVMVNEIVEIFLKFIVLGFNVIDNLFVCLLLCYIIFSMYFFK